MYWIDQEWRIFRNIKALETAGLELQQRRWPSLQQGCFRSIAGHISKSGVRESCVDIKRKNLHVVICGCLHRILKGQGYNSRQNCYCGAKHLQA